MIRFLSRPRVGIPTCNIFLFDGKPVVNSVSTNCPCMAMLDNVFQMNSFHMGVYPSV